MRGRKKRERREDQKDEKDETKRVGKLVHVKKVVNENEEAASMSLFWPRFSCNVAHSHR